MLDVASQEEADRTVECAQEEADRTVECAQEEADRTVECAIAEVARILQCLWELYDHLVQLGVGPLPLVDGFC